MEHNHSNTEITREETATQGASRNTFIRRTACYVLGMLILAFGVSFSIKSDLGVSPVNSLPYVFSRILNVDIGIATASLFAFYVLVQILLLRREFQWKNLLQIAVGMLFGSFVSLTSRLVAFDTPEQYALRLLLMSISILLVALGLTLILRADIMPQPPDGLILAIQHKSGLQYPTVKTMFDCVSVALAAAFGLLLTHTLVGVREGTALSALLVGTVMAWMRKLYGNKLDAWLRRAPKETTK